MDNFDKFVFVLAAVFMYNALEFNSPEPLQAIHTYSVAGDGDNPNEVATCEFDKPLTHITLITHWYDSNDEMYADYITLADPADREEIWGWSNCIWQPEDDWAACDVYVVKPDFVHADMNIDTLGHEIFHGACGDFHE